MTAHSTNILELKTRIFCKKILEHGLKNNFVFYFFIGNRHHKNFNGSESQKIVAL